MKKTGMARLFTLALAATMVLSMAACTGTAKKESSKMQSTSSSSVKNSSGAKSSSGSKKKSSSMTGSSSKSEKAESTKQTFGSEKTESKKETLNSGSSKVDPNTKSVSPSGSADKLVSAAKAALGKPFASNGCQLSTGFDSSGLLYYAAKESGLTLPRRIADQVKAGTKVTYDQLQPGDLVFFSGEKAGVAQIGGVVVSNGVMIISTKPGDKVHEQQITSNYWKTHFVGGVRLG